MREPRNDYPEGQLFTPELIQAAQERWLEEEICLLPVSIAYLEGPSWGSKMALLTYRRGDHLYIRQTNTTSDGEAFQVANWALNWVFENQPQILVVNVDGLGSGLLSSLSREASRRKWEFGVELRGMSFAQPAFDQRYYRIYLDELYFRLRDTFERLSVPRGDEVYYDMQTRHWGWHWMVTEKRFKKVESRMEVKKRGGGSTHITDGLAALMFGEVREEARGKREARGPRFVEPAVLHSQRIW